MRAWTKLYLAAVAFGCKPTVDKDPEFIQHRLQSCEAWCRVQADPVCGYGPSEAYENESGCVRECATADGALAWGWGYQEKTETDACVSEWKAVSACVLALPCEEQHAYFADASTPPPPDQRPCWAEWTAMSTCTIDHPCCGDS